MEENHASFSPHWSLQLPVKNSNWLFFTGSLRLSFFSLLASLSFQRLCLLVKGQEVFQQTVNIYRTFELVAVIKTWLTWLFWLKAYSREVQPCEQEFATYIARYILSSEKHR